MKVLTDKLIQTCGACPSQWDGVTDDDRAVYIRYRWGYLSVRASEPGDQGEWAGVEGEEILGVQLGDEWDGVLLEDELTEVLAKHNLGEALALPEGRMTREEIREGFVKAGKWIEKMEEEGRLIVVDVPEEVER